MTYISSKGEMKMSLSEMTWATLILQVRHTHDPSTARIETRGPTNILVPEVLQELELAIRPLR